MATSLSEIFAALQNSVVAINRVRQQVAATFPRMGTVTSSAPAVGAVTFTSSQATGFLSVTTSSGYVGWIPTYPSS
jgi:hypothetical protein